MAKKIYVSKDRDSGRWNRTSSKAPTVTVITTKSLLDAANRAVEQKDVHVLPSEGSWTVRREGASRAAKVFDKKSDAVEWGRQSAKKDGTALVIHGADGRIHSMDSYGTDPMPPTDKK